MSLIFDEFQKRFSAMFSYDGADADRSKAALIHNHRRSQ
jgi:hypothetical protein